MIALSDVPQIENGLARRQEQNNPVVQLCQHQETGLWPRPPNMASHTFPTAPPRAYWRECRKIEMPSAPLGFSPMPYRTLDIAQKS